MMPYDNGLGLHRLSLESLKRVCADMQKSLIAALMVAAILATSGCKNLFRAYRIDIVQGQVATREQAEQLKPGMSPAQVRYILGTPLITDTLNPSRWDYTYRFLPGTYAKDIKLPTVEHRRLTVVFADGVLDHTELDGQLPSKAVSLPASKDSAVRSSETNIKEDAKRP